MSVPSSFPTNVVLSAVHASFDVPETVQSKLSEEMKAHDFRLLRGCSDHATRELVLSPLVPQ